MYREIFKRERAGVHRGRAVASSHGSGLYVFVLNIGSTTTTSFRYICLAALAIVLFPWIMTVETAGSIVQSVTAVKNVSCLMMLMNSLISPPHLAKPVPSLPPICVGIDKVREQDTPQAIEGT